jgi:hypothetical protein
MHVNIKDIEGKEILPGVIERELLSRSQSIPGGLAVHHYVLDGGEVILGEENTEYQLYIISGCGRMGGRFLHGETAVFVPGAQPWGNVREHRPIHEGEGELRIITASHKTGRQNFRWAKTRVKILYETVCMQLMFRPMLHRQIIPLILTLSKSHMYYVETVKLYQETPDTM